MKLKALLIVLVFTVVGAACGKRVEYVMGQPGAKGDKGDTGEAGEDSTGCYDEDFGPSEEYPNGGVVIICDDDDPIVLSNGGDKPCYKKHRKHKKDAE